MNVRRHILLGLRSQRYLTPFHNVWRCVRVLCWVPIPGHTFAGHEHVRIADLPGMWERTLTLGTASKMLSLTGWRVGWLVAPPELIQGANTRMAHDAPHVSLTGTA